MSASMMMLAPNVSNARPDSHGMSQGAVAAAAGLIAAAPRGPATIDVGGVLHPDPRLLLLAARGAKEPEAEDGELDDDDDDFLSDDDADEDEPADDEDEDEEDDEEELEDEDDEDDEGDEDEESADGDLEGDDDFDDDDDLDDDDDDD